MPIKNNKFNAYTKYSTAIFLKTKIKIIYYLKKKTKI